MKEVEKELKEGEKELKDPYKDSKAVTSVADLKGKVLSVQ